MQFGFSFGCVDPDINPPGFCVCVCVVSCRVIVVVVLLRVFFANWPICVICMYNFNLRLSRDNLLRLYVRVIRLPCGSFYWFGSLEGSSWIGEGSSTLTKS